MLRGDITKEGAFDLGWKMACRVANREDLLKNINEKSYRKSREKAFKDWRKSLSTPKKYTKDEALKMLKQAGIVDSSGNLSKHYR